MIRNVMRRRQGQRRRGQGMTEYIIVVGLVAILLIAAVKKFSDTLGTTFDNSTKRLDNDVTKAIAPTPPTKNP